MVVLTYDFCMAFMCLARSAFTEYHGDWPFLLRLMRSTYNVFFTSYQVCLQLPSYDGNVLCLSFFFLFNAKK